MQKLRGGRYKWRDGRGQSHRSCNQRVIVRQGIAWLRDTRVKNTAVDNGLNAMLPPFISRDL